MGTKDMGDCFVSFNVRSVSSSSMARSIRWPWVLLILILISLPGEHGVGASAAPPPPGDSCNSHAHASSAAGKIAVEIIGGLLSGVFFVGTGVAQPLRFFICHSGGRNQEGKNFPERLYDEMTRSWKLKFFITVFFDRKVLRDGLLFPVQILKELETTQVGIVLVTKDIFTRTWPMVELLYFVESSERSSNMQRVLPLFYKMTVRQVQDSLRDGVWEGEWRKMSTGGDHPLSVERCRHAVRELCKYKGVEYSGSDRERDREYIREILKRVGKILCEEIWKNIRARNLENSSWRGHAPDRRKIGTLSTKSPISSSQDPNSLDENDRQIARALSEENQYVDNEVGNPLTKPESMKDNEEEHQYVDKEVGNRLTKAAPITKGDKKEWRLVPDSSRRDREVGNRLTKLELTKPLGEAKAFLGEALELMEKCYDGKAANNSRLSAVRTDVAKSVLLYRDLHLALTKEVMSDMKQGKVEHHSARAVLYEGAKNANLRIGALFGVLTRGATTPITYKLHEAAKWKQTEHEVCRSTFIEEGGKQEEELSDEGEMARGARDKINGLIVALFKFTEAITTVSGFFNVLKTDVQSIADSTKKGSLDKSKMTSVFYRILRNNCGKITQASNEYLAYDPIARAKIGELEKFECDGNVGPDHARQWYQEHKGKYNLAIKDGRVTSLATVT